MSLFFKCYSLLLSYPSNDFLDIIAEIETSVTDQLAAKQTKFKAAKHQDLSGLREICKEFHQQISSNEAGLTDLQAVYVQIFDMTPELSLHLTHHVLGSDKNRGPALIDLSLYYQEHGFELEQSQGNELPDFLPLMLEFAAQQDIDEAKAFLIQWEKVILQIEANLSEIAKNQTEAEVYAKLFCEIRRFTLGNKNILGLNINQSDLEQRLANLASSEAVKYAVHPQQLSSSAFTSMLNDDSEDERGSELAVNWQQPDFAALNPTSGQAINFYPRKNLTSKLPQV